MFVCDFILPFLNNPLNLQKSFLLFFRHFNINFIQEIEDRHVMKCIFIVNVISAFQQFNILTLKCKYIKKNEIDRFEIEKTNETC